MAQQSVSLTGVRDQSGNTINDVSIKTNVIYTVSTTTPPTCSSIITGAGGTSTVDYFLEHYKIKNTGSNADTSNVDLKKNLDYFHSALTNSNVDQRINVATSDENTAIQTYLTNLETTQLPILRLVDSCMREAVMPNYKELQDQKELTDESKLRLESVKDPETKVSYYEGWFPLFRPISEPALFGIFVSAMTFLLFATGIFIRMAGIDIQIISPTFFYTGGATSYKTYMYYGLGVGVIAGIGVYGYYNGWFDKLLNKV